MSLSSAAIIFCLRCRHPPPPSSTATATITTPLSLPSLTALSRPSPSQSAAQSHVLLSSVIVIIRHRCRPPLPYLCSSSLLMLLVCGRASSPLSSPLIRLCCQLSPAPLVISFLDQPLLIAVELRLSSLLSLDVDCCAVGDKKSHPNQPTTGYLWWY